MIFQNIPNSKYFFFPFLLMISLISGCPSEGLGQNITGNFPALAGQSVSLIGFAGFDTCTIATVYANDKGVFSLTYSHKDYGMGYITTKDQKPFLVALGKENVKLRGETPGFAESVIIEESVENTVLKRYSNDYIRREQALSAWDYLEKIYKHDSLFMVQEVPNRCIATEKQRLKAEDSSYLAGLDPLSYMSWYLPVRKRVSSVATIAQYRTEEIPSTLAFFRNLDYTDNRLYKSGLLTDVIESHFWLIENSEGRMDSMYQEMNKSIDIMVANLLSDHAKLNTISNYLFRYLEKRSLFKASEYLAIKLLTEQGCNIIQNLADQLESYRAMKKGKKAPDFKFANDLVAPGHEASQQPKKLSDLNSLYTLLVFGASWCPQCPQELSLAVSLYEKWKQQGVEVVFVSLDHDSAIFKSFTNIFPFISVCDYKKWESPVVKKYHVFATPTLFLLDQEQHIILRPNSVSHADAWVDWYLVQGNKQPGVTE